MAHTLAPEEPSYRVRREQQLNTRIACVRAACAADTNKQALFLRSMRKEFEDEESRRERVRGELQSLIALTGTIVAALGVLGMWLAQSHILRATSGSVGIVAALALYPILQMVGAFLAATQGWRVRSYHPMPHAAEALGDPMDVAEEIMRSGLSNTYGIDEMVSYKKVAQTCLRNAGFGFIPLLIAILTIIVHNMTP